MTSSWDNLSIIRGQWHTLSQEVISLLEIKGRVRQSVDGTKFVISQRERVGWTLKNNLMVPRVHYMAWLDWQKDIIVTGDHLVVLAADNFNTLRPEQNNRLFSQIPQCNRQIALVHISVTKCCIVGYGTGALWYLCDRSLVGCLIQISPN